MSIDWQELFVPQTPLLEMVLRGTVMYFLLLAALRVLVRRHVGSMSLMDLLLLVLIADAAQNAMAGDYKTITEGAVLCGTLVAWNCFLDWLAYRSKFVAALLEPSPLPLVKDGQVQRRSMRQELVTLDELMSHLRQQGIEDISQVKRACLEPDGGISVIRKDGPNDSGSSEQRQPRDKHGAI